MCLVCADNVYKLYIGPGFSLLRFPLGGSTAIKVLSDKTRQIARYFEEAVPRIRHPHCVTAISIRTHLSDKVACTLLEILLYVMSTV